MTSKQVDELIPYSLQSVPDKFITADLCKTALQHPDADKNVSEFIPERVHHNPGIRKIMKEKSSLTAANMLSVRKLIQKDMLSGRQKASH
ncbi:MAG: hypothetical protein FWF54_06720 [Candidatus Azobacteroides sp.]|nr:hypothetical protein [Candidatus Azobacteroides sp.]